MHVVVCPKDCGVRLGTVVPPVVSWPCSAVLCRHMMRVSWAPCTPLEALLSCGE